jgi:hypothetical protein
MWLAGNIAFYAPDRPSVFADADPAVSAWIDPAALAVAGAVLVWDAAGLRQRFPAAIGQIPVALAKPCPRAQSRSHRLGAAGAAGLASAR